MVIRKKTQSFNDGVVSIYAVTDTAAAGDKPVMGITLRQTLRYAERTVGITRFYSAKQAGAEVRYVLRCPRLRDISTQDVAVPNDGKQYKIIQVQYPEDVDPAVMDLTLEGLTSLYEIYQPVTEEEGE
jgi:hypothetical protein